MSRKNGSVASRKYLKPKHSGKVEPRVRHAVKHVEGELREVKRGKSVWRVEEGEE